MFCKSTGKNTPLIDFAVSRSKTNNQPVNPLGELSGVLAKDFKGLLLTNSGDK